MYDPDQMPQAVPQPLEREQRPSGGLDKKLRAEGVEFEAGEIGRLRANYAGNVSLIDDQIGQILKVIENRGELDNTVIIHTSDHGEMAGDYGTLYKSNFLNGAVRIPLLVRTPEAARESAGGAVCQSPVELFDVGPTFVELAGGVLTHQQFATSLCPLLRDPSGRQRDGAISEIRGEIMLLDERWKIALNTDGETYLLFDQQNDPQEMDNLAGLASMQPVETKLRSRILRRLVGSQRDLERDLPRI
jgi:choline-sulfatase